MAFINWLVFAEQSTKMALLPHTHAGAHSAYHSDVQSTPLYRKEKKKKKRSVPFNQLLL